MKQPFHCHGVCAAAAAFFLERDHTTSSGLWRRLANNDRDVVGQGMTWRGTTSPYASRKQVALWTLYNKLWPDKT